jgi:hypothetical protein
MDRRDTEKIARYLTDDYIFPIKVTENPCPNCFIKGKIRVIKTTRDSPLDSPTSRGEARNMRYQTWMQLFLESGLCPIQTINAYVPSVRMNGKIVRNPEFSYPLIITGGHGELCKTKFNCDPMCLICNTPLSHLPSLRVNPWTIPVHDTCIKECGFSFPGGPKGACCTAPVLTVPKLFEDTLKITIRCSKHRADRVEEEPVKPAAKAKGKSLAEKPKSTMTVPEVSAVQIVPKPPNKKAPPPKLLKIQREKEKGCHDIRRMLDPERFATEQKEQPKFKQARTTDESVSRGPGTAYLYGAGKFDFSEPKRLPVPGSGDSTNEKDKDEAGAGASDGKD